MKRINIDTKLIIKIQEFNRKIYEEQLNDNNHPKKKLDILRKKYCTLNRRDMSEYIAKICENYSELLNAQPSSYEKWKNEFNLLVDLEKIIPILKIKKRNAEQSSAIVKSCQKLNCEEKDVRIFVNEIIEAMCYKEYRSIAYPRIINELGWNLKVCFYCNYTGTLTIKSGVKNCTAYYDLDHVLPKSKFPFLATSFFNFIPSCPSCNRRKSNKIINNLNPFHEDLEGKEMQNNIFTIEPGSKVLFYLQNDKNKLEIKVSSEINSISIKDYKEIVDLELLYNSQKHITEEILWKKKIYKPSYLAYLQNQFRALRLNEADINRILWGTDLDEININDLPMAKFKLDLIKGN